MGPRNTPSTTYGGKITSQAYLFPSAVGIEDLICSHLPRTLFFRFWRVSLVWYICGVEDELDEAPPPHPVCAAHRVIMHQQAFRRNYPLRSKPMFCFTIAVFLSSLQPSPVSALTRQPVPMVLILRSSAPLGMIPLSPPLSPKSPVWLAFNPPNRQAFALGDPQPPAKKLPSRFSELYKEPNSMEITCVQITRRQWIMAYWDSWAALGWNESCQ